jgi:protein gp37
MHHKQHPLSAVFPLLTAQQYAELRADIAADGLRMPIILYCDAVLDGWHRYRICRDLGFVPMFQVFEGNYDAARRLVISLNVRRRQMTTGEIAIAVAKLIVAADEQGERLTIAPLAEQAHLSERTLKDAALVIGSGDRPLIAQVEAGALSVKQGAQEVRRRKVTVPPFRPPETVGPYTLEQWQALSAERRRAALACRDRRARLNRENAGENDNLIDWARWTWNPITGCEHDCPYCYARDIAERFPTGFAPTFHPERLAAPLNMAPPASEDPRDRRIFVCSMADLFGRWVPAELIHAVLDIAAQASAWEFLMLTKFPKRMAEFEIPGNVWMGTTVDCQARVAAAEAAFERVRAKWRWLSVEPMLERLTFHHLERFDLVVIGGASKSNRTPLWFPPYEWRANLVEQAHAAGCAVYEKSNLCRKETPGGSRYHFTDELPKVFDYLRGRKQDSGADVA